MMFRFVMVCMLVFSSTTMAMANEMVKAIDQGNLHKVEALLKKGAQVDESMVIEEIDEESNTYLYAVYKGNPKMVQLFLDHGANVDSCYYRWGVSPLGIAVEKDNWEMMSFLLSKGAKADADCLHGVTPLMEAASDGKERMARFLIEHGADVNARSTRFEYTPLGLAIEGGHMDIVALLLEKGAYVEKGRPPLLSAAEKGSLSKLKAFLVSIPESAAKTNTMNEALRICAIDPDGKELIAELLEYGADINAADKDGTTPLMRAAKMGTVEMLDFLLSKGANLHAKDAQGATALIEAAGDDRGVDKVKFLVERGADIRTKSNTGKTVLSEAKRLVNTKLLQWLESQGIK